MFSQVESSPTRVSVVRQVQIILAFVAQFIFFHEIPGVVELAGAGLVLLVVLAVPFEKNITDIKKKKIET